MHSISSEISKTHWSSWLPPVFHWCDKVVKKMVTTPPADSVCFIPVLCRGESYQLCASGLEADLEKNIIEKLALMKWKGRSFHQITLPIKDRTFILQGIDLSYDIHSPVVKVGVSREIGLHFAASMHNISFANISFFESESINLLNILEGFVSGLYDMKTIGKKIKKKEIDLRDFAEQIFLITTKISLENLKYSFDKMRSALFCRFLQDLPANFLTPERLCDIIEEIGKEEKNLIVKIYKKSDLEQERMGALLSVAKGATSEARMIAIHIKGKDSRKKIALIGKGVTFDSGGLSLKPSSGMSDMKYDMSGAAVVLSSALFFARHQPAIDVHCLVGAAENLPGPYATKPGDIIVSRQGKTIEILDTDAEGRLMLVDLLDYAQDMYKPDYMIDLATLTGAAHYSIGAAGSVLLGNNDSFKRFVSEAGEKEYERYCVFPFWPEYQKSLKTKIADIKNIADSTTKAGSITAGFFLSEFVRMKRWVHLDIAGTAYNCAALGFPKKGGSAFGLQTLLQVCTSFDEKKLKE